MPVRRRAATRPQIAAKADFHRNLPLYQSGHQLAVVPGVQAVANALGAQVDCAPHRLRPGGFTGMRGQAQAVLTGAGINFAEELRRAAALIAANAEADHALALLAAFHSLFYNPLRGIRTEMAHSVEDPEQRDTKIFFSSHAPGFNAAKDLGEVLP